MLFSTPFFIFVFLPVFLALYALLPFRSATLLLASLVFYGWSEPVFIWVVIASGAIDWWLGARLAAAGPAQGKPWLVTGVVSNLALLLYTKYTGFALGNLNILLTSFGLGAVSIPDIALPLGVSFIVFEKITYLVDIHRGRATPATSFIDYLNYVFLFPKLLAGPIIKYHDIAPQLTRPVHRWADIHAGMGRFLVGLSKKVLLSDLVAPTGDAVFNLTPDQLDTPTAWIGLFCFTLQIYFDFSGYSDMAIGLGRMLGFHLLENFRQPYLATSITDFWRRWHISLSTWIKEYLYIPLGGSRVSTARSYLNLCLCFLLSGLWHGASWNFLIWGVSHGLLLVADRAFWLNWQTRLPRWFNTVLTFFLVALTWVFFRCETFAHARDFMAALFGRTGPLGNTVVPSADVWGGLAVASLCVLLPGWKPAAAFFSTIASRRVLCLTGMVVLLIFCTIRMSVSSFHPFLYFRF
ncbi:MAG: Membrane bound O-acyl transferase family protein [Verrucomicrobiales bacterium]|nr:Membrane bound O-acyl transferase family protein [Verrucomicrobiales bacterium]